MTPTDYIDIIRNEKHCSVCMKKGAVEPHHINQIGMGRDRKRELEEKKVNIFKNFLQKL